MNVRLWIAVGAYVGAVAIIATVFFTGLNMPAWCAAAVVTVFAVLGGLIGPLLFDGRPEIADAETTEDGPVRPAIY
jgi:hypothetical protein